MKGKLLFVALSMCVLAVAGIAQADEVLTTIRINGLDYVFGHDNGLIRIEDTSHNIVYDFGERPCWFMLTYLNQYLDEKGPKSEAWYIYPQLGADPKYDFLFTSYEIGESYVEYNYNYYIEEQEVLHVILLFDVKKTGPFTGVAVYISVDNRIPDGSKGKDDDSVVRLMEVHCPFVRLPKIGNYRSDDVLTMGNYLVNNPIENLKNAVEPWNVNEKNGAYENEIGKKYPRDFPVYAYYDTGENPGRGLYFALYNGDRKVCKSSVFKHMGTDFWPAIGNEPNQPQGNFANYILWDVVKYPEGVDEAENDFMEISSQSDKNLCAFITFYDGDAQTIDWYKAAQKYRDDVIAIDENCPSGNCPPDFSYFSGRDVNDLWPDYKIKDNENIEDWVKYQPLMLYVSPQADPSLEYVYTDQPTPAPPYAASHSFVLDRIRQYQERFGDYLEIKDGLNNLLVSSWIYEWAPDTGPAGKQRHIGLTINHPEWSWGLMPIDSNPPSSISDEDWKHLFIRDGFDTFMEQLATPAPSTAKYIAHEGAYYFDTPREIHPVGLLFGNNKWDQENKNEWFEQSWAYNDIDRLKLHDKIYGKELRYRWGSEYPGGKTGWLIPTRDNAVWQIFPGDKDGMDFLCGKAVPNYGLDGGVLDSLIRDADRRFLNADGMYTGKTGSDTFQPLYNGFPYRGSQNTQFLKDLAGNDIKPGGGNQMYKAYEHIFETLKDLPGSKMFMTENFGECFLKYYDMVRVESWPALDCVDTESRGMFTYAKNLKVELEAKSDYLPVQYIPFIQALSHEYMIVQDGTNAFPPDQYWHKKWLLKKKKEGQPEIKGIQWPYYGGASTSQDDKWLAYNADIAYTFCYGTRLFIYDVDLPTDDVGNPTDDDFHYTLNLLNESEADDYGSLTLLENSLKYYNASGWPENTDKPAEALFFGKLLPSPNLTTSLSFVNCQYDLTGGMEGPDEELNVTIRSYPVLNTLWKTEMPLSSGNQDRLVMVFTNFSNQSYRVFTNPIDITEYLPNASEYYFFSYPIDGALLKLNQISDPANFQIKAFVRPCKNTIFGILGKNYPIPPPSGLYARLNDDDFQDLILLDDGPDKTLSVVMGDGSGSYDELNAIPIMNGVTSVDTILNEDKAQDLVCLTETAMKIIRLETAGSPETVMDSGDIFDSASKMKTLVRTKDAIKIVVLDDIDLKTLDISKSVKDSDEDYAFQLKEVECEAVVNFETGWLNDDGFCDIATITTDGSVEILSIHEGDPASQVIIEIGTTATSLEIDDSDLDGDADIILEGQGKSGGDVLSNVGGWKFTQ